MELALITKFTFIDGLSLILSVLGVILYGTIVYALLFKKNSIHQEKIVLFFGSFFILSTISLIGCDPVSYTHLTLPTKA